MEELFRLNPARALLVMLALILVLGVVAQIAARRVHLPAILLLMGLGFLLGPHGAGVIEPARLGFGLQTLLSAAVAVILFDGALRLDLAPLRRQLKTLAGLVLLGGPVTILASSLVVHHLVGLSAPTAVLAGSILSLTGPTVIFPLLKRLPLKPDLKTVLEAESVLVNAVGLLLTAAVFESLVMAHAGPGSTALAFLYSLGVGLAAGLVGTWSLGFLVARMPADLVRLSVLSVTLCGYAAAEFLAPYSGIVTVAIAGVGLGRRRSAHLAGIQQLMADLTLMAVGLVFVLLSASVQPSSIGHLGWRGPAVVVAVMLLIRPLAVAIATWRAPLSWGERAFLAWLGPRGLVAGSMAALVAMRMGAEGIPGGEAMVTVVMLTVLATVALQGTSAAWVAARLGLLVPRPPEAEPAPAAGLRPAEPSGTP